MSYSQNEADLIAENARLKHDCEILNRVIKSDAEVIADLRAQLSQAQAAVELHKELGRYTRHTVTCDIHRKCGLMMLPATCDCGLSELQKKVRAILERKGL